MKVYAVKKGHQTGIFDNWADCQAATKGFSGPEFKRLRRCLLCGNSSTMTNSLKG